MKVLIGNIFDSKCNALINTVNCVGVMGNGIAAKLKKDIHPCLKSIDFFAKKEK